MTGSAGKLVLFDLGKTLEDDDVLLPGALEMLDTVAALRHSAEPAVRLGLVSDFDMPDPGSPEQIPQIQREYYAVLDMLGIRELFEPVAERVTLSTEVGAFKPDEAVFRTATTKAGVTFADTMFITENGGHVLAARALGLTAVHFRGPGQVSGDVATLLELVPIVRSFAGLPATTDDAAPDLDVAVLRITPDTAAAAQERATAAGTTWTRLGEDLVVTGDHEAVERVIGNGAPTVTARFAAPAGHLRLVLQNGSLFQQEHPAVPVVAGRGRHLVVRLDPAWPPVQHGDDVPCYAIRPLPRYTTVVAPYPAAESARAPSPAWVRECVERLRPATFDADLRAFTALPTRHSTSADFRTATTLARDRLTGLGYVTSTEPVQIGGATSHNLIAERAGAGTEPRDVVVVTAHLDSINIAGGPSAPAPGADDNGSGSAGLLSIAEALAAHPARLDLRLVLFGGEEQGLFGSRRHVARLGRPERDRIRAVVNMDMIGTLNTTEPGVLLEGAALSQPVIDGLAAAAAEFTTLAVATSLTPFNSDHVPFLDAGIPAVLTIEGADGSNASIHSAADTLDTIDTDLALAILRMNVGYLAELLGTV